MTNDIIRVGHATTSIPISTIFKPFEEIIPNDLYDNINIDWDHFRKSTQIQKSHPHDVYPMQTKNRGILFLVNIINFDYNPNLKRNGAKIDKYHLIKLFRDCFGFTVYYFEDITKIVSNNDNKQYC